MDSNPLWVVPAVTASASLLGTIVGGLATYWTSKTSHDRAAAAQEATQRYTLLREAAMRFVASMSDMPGPGSGLERMIRQWGPVADELMAARTDEELVKAAQAIDPTIKVGEGRVGVMIRLVRKTGVYDEVVQRRFTLLTELRLIAPGDVADSAQRVLYRAFAQEVTGAITPHLHRQAIDAFNREINEFVNLVRHHMNDDDIEFEFINEEVMQKLLEAED
jgi:hypothetical protein